MSYAQPYKKRKPIVPDVPKKRPGDLAEKRVLVREVYRENDWTASEHNSNCALLNMPLKKLENYGETELDVFIADFEQNKMVIFE